MGHVNSQEISDNICEWKFNHLNPTSAIEYGSVGEKIKVPLCSKEYNDERISSSMTIASLKEFLKEKEIPEGAWILPSNGKITVYNC